MANFWQNLFNPVPEEGENEDSRRGESTRKEGKNGIAGDLKELRHVIDRDGEAKDTLPAELKDLANKAGFTLPAGMKLREQVTALQDYVFGKKKASKKRGRSIPDLIDEMVEELDIHPDPSDDQQKRLELVEAELGKDADTQKDKPLKDRLVECWGELFGTN